MIDNPQPIAPDMLELTAARTPMHPASINCHTCGTCVWSGGEVADDADRSIIGLPFGDHEDRGGNTVSVVIAAARAWDPAGIVAEIAELKAALARLTSK
jgi:hypothetical protein